MIEKLGNTLLLFKSRCHYPYTSPSFPFKRKRKKTKPRRKRRFLRMYYRFLLLFHAEARRRNLQDGPQRALFFSCNYPLLPLLLLSEQHMTRVQNAPFLTQRSTFLLALRLVNKKTEKKQRQKSSTESTMSGLAEVLAANLHHIPPSFRLVFSSQSPSSPLFLASQRMSP